MEAMVALKEEIENMPTILTIKEEEQDEEEELPKPLEGLHEIGPPPFLSKTFEMVEDPETNPIVSWGVTAGSFVVWDPHKFSTDLLPKYFKHRNFSSFIRQLNTYGFRKVHLDRWEFANSGFQRGKKHLLKTMKRRNGGANNNARLKLLRETEVEKLKQEQEELKLEIHDLKQQKQDSDLCLAAMEERIKHAEWKQREFVILIAKAMKRTSFFQQLLLSYRQKKVLANGEISKKRRLASSESLENLILAKGTTQNSDQCCEEDMVAIRSDTNSFPGTPPIDLGPCDIQEPKSSLTSDTSSPDLCSGSYIMWEKLMEDDVICEDKEEETLSANQTKFVHELENLIAKPPTWVGLANVGEVACPIGQ